jgi:transcriptional regulator with XRE-family HTH domain
MNISVVDNEEMSRRRHDKDDISTLGGRLRRRRKELGWTQVHLAERVGTSQAVIQKIENGKSLRPRILEEIAAALGVRPAWLQFGVEEVGELNEEAIELARAWSRLDEPHRSAMKEAILKIGASAA